MKKVMRIVLWILAFLASVSFIFSAVSRLVYHRSNAATAVEIGLRLSKANETYATKENAEKYLKDLSGDNRAEYEIPKDVKFTVDVKDMKVGETKVFLLNDTGHNEKAILYFPGGAYVSQPTEGQWMFAQSLALATDAEVIVAVYPKLPQFTYKQAYADLQKLIPMITAGYGWDNVSFVGDSSGGGLAAGYCEYLSYTGQRQPGNLILLSPWVDATLENPKVDELAEVDPMLAPEGLRVFAEKWAGDTDLKYYQISPLYGDVSGLRNVMVFTGTREIFYPDEQLFAQKLQTAGVDTKFFVGQGLNHNYPMHSTSEGKKAMAEIIAAIVGPDANEEEETSA